MNIYLFTTITLGKIDNICKDTRENERKCGTFIWDLQKECYTNYDKKIIMKYLEILKIFFIKLANKIFK